MKVADLKEFDAADYLLDTKDDAAYLNAWLEDGTPEELQAALATIARARGMREVSDATGMNRTTAYKSFGEGGNPSFANVKAMLASAGLRLVVERIDGKRKRKSKAA